MPRQSETEEGQGAALAQHSAGAIDGTQEPGLVQPCEAGVRHVGLQDAERHREQPEDSLEAMAASLELGDASVEFEDRPVVGGQGDGARSLLEPYGRRGPWDACAGGDFQVAGLLDDTDQPVVVGSAVAPGLHPATVAEAGRRFQGPARAVCRALDGEVQSALAGSTAVYQTAVNLKDNFRVASRRRCYCEVYARTNSPVLTGAVILNDAIPWWCKALAGFR